MEISVSAGFNKAYRDIVLHIIEPLKVAANVTNDDSVGDVKKKLDSINFEIIDIDDAENLERVVIVVNTSTDKLIAGGRVSIEVTHFDDGDYEVAVTGYEMRKELMDDLNDGYIAWRTGNEDV